MMDSKGALTGLMLAVVIGLGGCAAWPESEQAPRLTLYAYLNLSEQVRLTALLPEDAGRAAGAKVVVLDDLGRVYLESALDDEGQLRFRYPRRSVYIDIRVVSAEGLIAERRVELDDQICRRRLGCY